jgi:predicted metal-dependent hydrolase
LDPTDLERLREGIRLFNEGEFYACHDVLEEVWGDTLGPEKEFYQGLIHAAVALFHFEGGNLGGARRMYGSACAYLGRYGDAFLGVDLRRLRFDLEACFAELNAADDRDGYPSHIVLDDERIPRIRMEAGA